MLFFFSFIIFKQLVACKSRTSGEIRKSPVLFAPLLSKTRKQVTTRKVSPRGSCSLQGSSRTIFLLVLQFSEPGWRRRYSDSLLAGRSVDRIPAGARFSAPIQRLTQPPVQWVPGLSGGKGGRGVLLTTHPHLVCRGSRKRVELYLYSP